MHPLLLCKIIWDCPFTAHYKPVNIPGRILCDIHSCTMRWARCPGPRHPTCRDSWVEVEGSSEAEINRSDGRDYSEDTESWQCSCSITNTMSFHSSLSSPAAGLNVWFLHVHSNLTSQIRHAPNSLVGQKASWEAREGVRTHELQIVCFPPGQGHK